MKKILFIFLVFWYKSHSQVNIQNPQYDILDILHYDFRVNLSDTSDMIEGQTKVKIYFKKDMDSFYLDLVSKRNKFGMYVLFVGRNQYEVDFQQKNDKLWIREPMKIGDTSEFVINYYGIPADGLIISNNKYDDRCFFGDNWPNRAHNWLPCIDHPSDKATVEFEIIVPDHYTVVSTGKLIDKKELPDNQRYYHFNTEVPLPTKVMVVGIADFVEKNYGLVDSIPVSSLVFSKSLEEGSDDYFSSVDALKFYTTIIGDYPYEKLVNVQSKTKYGGMENAGNIFYYENSVTGKKEVEDLIAHEVAHQWFGNSVTEEDWHHIWLSEGFATYLADLYIENKYGEEAFKNRLKDERKQIINYNYVNQNPIIDTTIKDWNQLLNPNSYEKAAWVLHMLRNKIGDKFFFKSLKKYYETYRDKNALTEDFIDIVNSVSDTDLFSFFNQWLCRKSFPDLKINWNIKGEDLILEIIQKKDPFKLDLPVKISDGTTSEVFILKINDKTAQFLFRLPDKLNADKSTLMIDPDIEVLQKNDTYRDNNLTFNIPIIDNPVFLSEGDLLFQDLDCGELCNAIESVTSGFNGSKLSHVGVVANENGKLKVVEAIGDDVHYTEINDFLKRYFDSAERPKVIVGRLKDTVGVHENITKINDYIGKKYDDIFDMDNDSYYCSELVYFIYEKDNKSIFRLNPMTFKSLSSNEFFPAWIEYFKNIGYHIPEGKPGLNPGGISTSENIDIIYRFGDPDGWKE